MQVLARVKAATGHATVPQVFVGGQLLGGAAELKAALADGGLWQMLAATPAAALPGELQGILQSKAAALGPAGGAAGVAARDGSWHGRPHQLAVELKEALAAASSDHTFALQQAAQWLQQQGQGATPEAAAAALAELQGAQLLTVAVPAGSQDAELALSQQLAQQRPDLALRLVADAPPPQRWRQPLNGQFAWFGPARPAEQVGGWSVGLEEWICNLLYVLRGAALWWTPFRTGPPRFVAPSNCQVAEWLRLSLLRLYDLHLAADGRRVRYEALRADPEWQRFVAAAAELQKVRAVCKGRAGREGVSA